MTGDFSLALPVMLAVAIATAVSRALSYGTIYTTKLLRRGRDIDQAAPRVDLRGQVNARGGAGPGAGVPDVEFGRLPAVPGPVPALPVDGVPQRAERGQGPGAEVG
jgi:CIC family chloride channel protein